MSFPGRCPGLAWVRPLASRRGVRAKADSGIFRRRGIAALQCPPWICPSFVRPPDVAMEVAVDRGEGLARFAVVGVLPGRSPAELLEV